MKIKRVLTSVGLTGFYMDDKAAIRAGAKMDGFVYLGAPLTPGFERVRQPGESVSVIFALEGGEIAYGDCAVAQYAASGGREVPLRARQLAEIIERHLVSRLEGREVREFLPLAREIEGLEVEGEELPAAIRYGVSQAILEAAAKERGLTMAEVVAEEYGLELVLRPVPINAQSGDDRYTNVDKMILKRVGMMPHGLINNVEEKFGRQGEIFLEYARWVRDRILQIGDPDYRPVLRFDLYGTAGQAFGDDLDRVADYLLEVEKVCQPFEVGIEMPIDLRSKEAQLEGMLHLRKRLDQAGSRLFLIIDEYANTLEEIKEWVDARGADMVQVKTIDLGSVHNVVEAVLYCKAHGVRAYQGGTCNETDKSAQVCVHLAVATQPFAMAGKPGMGVDEGVMVVHNEQERLLAILRARRAGLI